MGLGWRGEEVVALIFSRLEMGLAKVVYQIGRERGAYSLATWEASLVCGSRQDRDLTESQP